MSVGLIRNGNERDAGVVEEICGYLTEKPGRSFFLFAGAGSGKTRTLVEVLRRLTGVVPHDSGGELARNLRLLGRSIRVITFTKNAVSVINGRLGNNDLVNVSTIHSFCWELIGGFDDDIREALIAVKTKQLERERLEASQKARGISATDETNFAEIEQDIEEFRTTEKFIYHPDRNRYGSGAIQHRHVLDATSWLLANRPTLRTILRDRHPIVLIDESQDTMKGVLDALMEVATPQGNGLTLGLLGDHRQRIYTDGHLDLPGLVPEGWGRPELQMNHRSQQRIVALINKIWEAEHEGRTQQPTGVKQHPRTEKTGGVVRVFVGDAKLGSDEKVKKEELCAELMADATSSTVWRTRGHQILALEHKLVATRGGFLQAYRAMDLLDPNAAAPQGSGENKGPTVARLLLEELIELAACVEADGCINEFAATEVLRRNGSLNSLPEDGATRQLRMMEMLQAIASFATVSSKPSATVREILESVLEARLFEVDSRLVAAFSDNSPAPAAPPPRTKEPSETRMRRGWCALFAAPWEELARYRNYLAGKTDLATHQVVKGSEFPHVMVVMDDSEAGGFQISYDKLFGAKDLSKNDVSNVDAKKETTIDRSLRLLYVTCSRARESLALVLWSENPDAALESIRKSKWFIEEEVLPVP